MLKLNAGKRRVRVAAICSPALLTSSFEFSTCVLPRSESSTACSSVKTSPDDFAVCALHSAASQTPKAIITTFADAVKQVMDSPEFKSNAEKTAFPSDYQSPEEYGAYIKKLEGIYRPLWDKYGKTAVIQ